MQRDGRLCNGMTGCVTGQSWASVRNIYIIIIGEGAKRARHSQVCSIENRIYIIITRILVTIKKRAGVIPYSFSSSIALLSSLLSCSFYLLDPRTISRVDILEMT